LVGAWINVRFTPHPESGHSLRRSEVRYGPEATILSKTEMLRPMFDVGYFPPMLNVPSFLAIPFLHERL
jgi:hypothetical protein